MRRAHLATATPLINLDALQDLIDARVEAALAKRGIEGTEYTSASPAPGVSRKTFNKWCSTRVEGSTHDGRGWRCTAPAWRAARAAGAKPGAQRNGGRFERARTSPSNDIELADEMLRAAGLRATR